jgi:hypothetical protein
MGKGAIKKPLNGQSKTAKKSKGAKKTGKDKKGKKTSNASCPDLVEFSLDRLKHHVNTCQYPPPHC